MKKKIKNLDVKYVLSPLEQSQIVSGAAGAECNCNVIVGNIWFIANTLIIVIEEETPIDQAAKA